MFIKDRFAEIILSLLDRIMDWSSRGMWTRIRESAIPNITKVKERI